MISLRLFLLTLLGWTIAVSVSYAQIPARPAKQEFFHDYAKAVGKTEEAKIRDLQKQIFVDNGVPIVVVTVTRMSAYEPSATNIKSFARAWFDTWEIGSQKKNEGILILISVGDRKGRIELGNDWGRDFDEYCQRVMDNDMVPEFKKGDYGNGILAGVELLAKMAKAGPNSKPPQPGISEQFQSATRFLNQDNPLSGNFGPLAPLCLILGGIACFVAAVFLPEHRKTLIITGIVLIALAVVFWLIFLLLLLFGKGRSSGSYSGGGSGGGFGGGFSGGGGATGSW